MLNPMPRLILVTSFCTVIKSALRAERAGELGRLPLADAPVAGRPPRRG